MTLASFVARSCSRLFHSTLVVAVAASSLALTPQFALATDLMPEELRLANGDQPERLNLFDLFRRMPQSLGVTADYSFSKGAIPAYVGILGSTLFLYEYDEDILKGWQRQGRDWGLSNVDHTKSFLNVGDIELFRMPTDTASLLYALGDGWTHTFIAGGFLASGYLRDNNRAFNTGMEIIQGMMLSTTVNQLFKRSFGRQSPNQKSEPRGAWTPFPSVAAYQARTAEYDAMPSGHIMTATMTFTVIRENYPEYDSYLLPLEVVYLSALAYGMVNNGVHWASDYPLGIGMGYVFGKGAASIAKKNAKAVDSTKPSSQYFPSMSEDGTLIANWMYRF